LNIEQIKDIKLNFILATARTGSTLLSSMLNAHPNVISTFEEPFALNLYPRYKNVKKWTSRTIQAFCYDFYLFSEGFLEVQFGKRKDLETILETHKLELTVDIAIRLTYLCFFPNKNKSEIITIVDKQLKFHLCIEKVALLFPESRFIILYRDPRDQALIRDRMSKRKNRKEDYYVISNIWQNTYHRLNRYKKETDSSRFLEIKYEDLVSNPEMELKKICSFIEIPYNSTMLNYNELINREMSETSINKNSLKEFTLFHKGLTQKTSTDKIGIWKQGLKPEEANLIWSVCGELAEKIGYKKDENFKKQALPVKNYLHYIVASVKRMIARLYYESPFSVKYLVKKIKYGRHFKSGRFAD
jgi:sulfotransferase family protein